MNHQRDSWKERQEVAVADRLALMTPEQRLAQVIEIVAKARALLDSRDPEEGEGEDITDAEYAEVDE